MENDLIKIKTKLKKNKNKFDLISRADYNFLLLK